MDEHRLADPGVELRHLRALVAIVDTGSFTDAAVDLGLSQAAVSRTLVALERALGARLLHRTSRSVAPTTAGEQVLARARMLLRSVDELVRETSTGRGTLRIGHAWSALGRHTARFHRTWRARSAVELHLIRHNTPTAGLAEGLCDLAVIRSAIDLRPWAHALVGHEPRYAALAADDPLARRRTLRLRDFTGRTMVIDRRTGTTTLDLWPPDARPAVEHTADIDDWLTEIATNQRVGISPHSTTTQYRRDGVVYRAVRDAPPVPVHVIWRRQDPHPATQDAVELLTELYDG